MTFARVDRSSRAIADAQAVRRIRDGVRRAMEEPLLRLLAINPCTLGGGGFEDYLDQVLSYRGYEVRRTGKTGDQGVDLIATRDGVMLAVQAKCYQNSVGKDAVQQVYAGITHYGCHRCVVITTSHFTSGARELAASVGCVLIEGAHIPMLLKGELHL